MGYRNFPNDNSSLAEMEFYLLEELEFDLVVFHPYRSLVSICGRSPGSSSDPSSKSASSSLTINAGANGGADGAGTGTGTGAGSVSSRTRSASKPEAEPGEIGGLAGPEMDAAGKGLAGTAEEELGGVAQLEEMDESAMQMAW